MAAFRLWKDVPEKVFGAPLKGGSISAEISPELLGVGYIIGPRIASIMMAGGVLSCLVLTPLIKFFGEGLSVVLPPGTKPIADMSPGDIRSAYILYIGAGAVAAGGIISLLRSLPIILQQRPVRAVGFQGRRRRPRLGPPHRAGSVHEVRRRPASWRSSSPSWPRPRCT